MRRIRQLAEVFRADFEARQEAHAARIAGFDTASVDAGAGMASFKRGDRVLWEGHAELIGRFWGDLGLFRWWWSGKEHHVKTETSLMDLAFAEAQRGDIRALLVRQMQLDGETDAELLCRVAAHLASARAMVRRTEGEQTAYYALFDGAGPSRPPTLFTAELEMARTMPPGAVAPVASTPPASASASLPLGAPVVTPPRDLMLPLAHAAAKTIRPAYPAGFGEALLIVTIDTTREKARFFAQIVATTPDGHLDAVDSTRELLDAVGHLITEDARAGNGRWRKLVLRVSPEGDGVAIRGAEVSV